MAVDRVYRIRIETVGNPSGAQATAGALDKVCEKTKEGGQESEKAQVSHQVLHKIFRQVGESSKGLEVGLMALSGVLMGSLTFGIYAVTQALRMLAQHFEKQKEVALEAAMATVQFWKDALQGNADARKAAEDYAEAMQKIINNVDALKQKEAEEEAVLKRVVEQRLKILEAELQAALAAAKGDKEEEARINARFGKRKTDIELQNEQANIDLKKRHLDEQTADAAAKERAAVVAEKAKEAGAPGRSDASAAEARMADLDKELVKLKAATIDPKDLAALREEVKRRAGESGFDVIPGSGAQESAAGSARRRLAAAENAAQDYSAAQQEYEQAQADIERFKTGTAKLAKAVEDANAELSKAVERARATAAEIGTAEASQKINVDAANVVKGVKVGETIQAAGVRDNPLSRSIVSDIQAMEGTSQGQKMDQAQTQMVNHLVAGLRAQGANAATINRLLAEMKDMHVDQAQKLADVWAALRQVRAAAAQDGFKNMP